MHANVLKKAQNAVFIEILRLGYCTDLDMYGIGGCVAIRSSFGAMFSRFAAVQVCDATADAQSVTAGNKIFLFISLQEKHLLRIAAIVNIPLHRVYNLQDG